MHMASALTGQIWEGCEGGDFRVSSLLPPLKDKNEIAKLITLEP